MAGTTSESPRSGRQSSRTAEGHPVPYQRAGCPSASSLHLLHSHRCCLAPSTRPVLPLRSAPARDDGGVDAPRPLLFRWLYTWFADGAALSPCVSVPGIVTWSV